jgi:dihydroneopterin aldolase
MTGRISLEGLEFHAFHGVYAHERESGNWFEVDISVVTDIDVPARTDNLSDAVNYETLFRIVKAEMDRPTHLLESVAGKIIQEVFATLRGVQEVHLKISKINPPLGGKCKRASVEIRQIRP